MKCAKTVCGKPEIGNRQTYSMLLTTLGSFYGTFPLAAASAHSDDVQYMLYGYVVKSYWMEVKPHIDERRQILQQIDITAE